MAGRQASLKSQLSTLFGGAFGSFRDIEPEILERISCRPVDIADECFRGIHQLGLEKCRELLYAVGRDICVRLCNLSA